MRLFHSILLLALATSLHAQEALPALTVDHFKGRRAALMAMVGEGVVFLRGAPKNGDNATFHQDHDFYYLTGIAEPDLALILLPETGGEVLLVPPFNRFRATWNGKFLAPGGAAAARTGFVEVGNGSSAAVLRRLDEVLATGSDGTRPVLWTALEPLVGRSGTSSSSRQSAASRRRDPFDGRGSRADATRVALAERYSDLQIENVSRSIARLRGVKAAAEIAAIRRATEIACEGIAEAMKSTEPGMMEYQVAAAARYVFSLRGAGADAYAAIVGGGPNGCILHYNALTRRLQDDDLIVMDYAPTWQGYASDVTRTFPADGTFSPEQRKLVQDVYEIQQRLIAEIKPGTRLRELSTLCGKLLMEKGYRPDHGPCHHVGLAVHDKGGDRLEAGMLITVEPGAYLRKEGMGCRIEDVVLVTDDGCINLSGHLPATPDAIEAMMQANGVLQLPVGLPRK